MRILVAEDDSFSAELLQKNLQEIGYEVVLAEDGADAWHILQSDNPPRLALLDWVMPSMDGLEVCRKVRRTGGPYVYIVLLTAKTETAEVVTGIEAGADDYMKKPYDLDELRARLRAGIRIVELEERLRYQATHDILTGLLNRPAILEALKAEFQRARRAGTALSVAIADLDEFKKINDNHGHLVGDDVLRETAERMRFALRSRDVIGRYGGEEFVAVFPACDLAEGAGTAERVREYISAEKIVADSSKISVTVSMGVADAQGFNDYESLIRAADDALLRAKCGGRNRVELARPPAGDTAAG